MGCGCNKKKKGSNISGGCTGPNCPQPTQVVVASTSKVDVGVIKKTQRAKIRRNGV
jgi:hypothetical protein